MNVEVLKYSWLIPVVSVSMMAALSKLSFKF